MREPHGTADKYMSIQHIVASGAQGARKCNSKRQPSMLLGCLQFKAPPQQLGHLVHAPRAVRGRLLAAELRVLVQLVNQDGGRASPVPAHDLHSACNRS